MSTDQNKALARRLYDEVWNKGNLEAVDELLGFDFKNHDAPNPFLPDGGNDREGLKKLVTAYRTAFPDVRFMIEDQLADGDKVVTRWSATGTSTGPLGPIPATGRPGIRRASGSTASRTGGSWSRGRTSTRWASSPGWASCRWRRSLTGARPDRFAPCRSKHLSGLGRGSATRPWQSRRGLRPSSTAGLQVAEHSGAIPGFYLPRRISGR